MKPTLYHLFVLCDLFHKMFKPRFTRHKEGSISQVLSALWICTPTSWQSDLWVLSWERFVSKLPLLGKKIDWIYSSVFKCSTIKKKNKTYISSKFLQHVLCGTRYAFEIQHFQWVRSILSCLCRLCVPTFFRQNQQENLTWVLTFDPADDWWSTINAKEGDEEPSWGHRSAEDQQVHRAVLPLCGGQWMSTFFLSEGSNFDQLSTGLWSELHPLRLPYSDAVKLFATVHLTFFLVHRTHQEMLPAILSSITGLALLINNESKDSDSVKYYYRMIIIIPSLKAFVVFSTLGLVKDLLMNIIYTSFFTHFGYTESQTHFLPYIVFEDIHFNVSVSI